MMRMDGEDGRQLSMAWRDEIRMLDSEVRTLIVALSGVGVLISFKSVYIMVRMALQTIREKYMPIC